MIRRNFAVVALALVLAAAVLQCLPTAAAAQEQMVELLRSDLKSEKKAVLTAAMDFTPEVVPWSRSSSSDTIGSIRDLEALKPCSRK